jgi:hypothetical protein
VFLGAEASQAILVSNIKKDYLFIYKTHINTKYLFFEAEHLAFAYKGQGPFSDGV